MNEKTDGGMNEERAIEFRKWWADLKKEDPPKIPFKYAVFVERTFKDGECAGYLLGLKHERQEEWERLEELVKVMENISYGIFIPKTDIERAIKTRLDEVIAKHKEWKGGYGKY